MQLHLQGPDGCPYSHCVTTWVSAIEISETTAETLTAQCKGFVKSSYKEQPEEAVHSWCTSTFLLVLQYPGARLWLLECRLIWGVTKSLSTDGMLLKHWAQSVPKLVISMWCWQKLAAPCPQTPPQLSSYCDRHTQQYRQICKGNYNQAVKRQAIQNPRVKSLLLFFEGTYVPALPNKLAGQ